MACLEMYNSSPRISFSYDFVESHQFNRPSSSTPPPPLPPASSDFEFSVSNHNMMCGDMICADELFSKGKLLPFKYNKSRPAAGNTTLRDELLTGHLEDEDISASSSTAAPCSKPPKSSGNRWKGFLGLRRSHIGSKKPEKTQAECDTHRLYNKSPQAMVSEGCQSSRDVEMGI